MKKRLLLTFAVIAMLVFVLAISVSASNLVSSWDVSANEDGNEDGNENGSITACLYDDGTLVFSGQGEMKRWDDYNEAPWYYHTVRYVEIGEGITSIGEYAFYRNEDLQSVTIPSTVTTIQRMAFIECESLTSVELPDGLKTIEADAFSSCTGLTSIVIPRSVEMVEGYAFAWSPNLTIRCEFAKEPSHWGLYWAWNTKAVNYALYEWDVSANGDGSVLAQLWANEGEDTYTLNVFGNGEMVDGYGPWYESHEFDHENITSIVIGEGITKIGSLAFADTSITSILFPRSLVEIGSRAFEGTDIVSVSIPNNVKRIGERAFAICESLTYAEIGMGVEEIGSAPFAFSKNLEQIYVHDRNPYFVEFNGYLYTTGAKDGEVTILQYALASGFEKIRIPNHIDRIANCAFNGAVHLKELIFEPALSGKTMIIESAAFANCFALELIDFGDASAQLDLQCFAACESLTKVKFGNGPVEIVGNYVFWKTNVEKVVIGKGLSQSALGFAPFSSGSVDEFVVLESPYFCAVDGSLYTKDKSTLIYYANGKDDKFFAIPLETTSVGKCAFVDTWSLETLFVHKNVSSFGRNWFSNKIDGNWVNFTTIYCEAESQPAEWDTGWSTDAKEVVWGHTHSFGDWVEVDSQSHTKACACGVTVTEEHNIHDFLGFLVCYECDYHVNNDFSLVEFIEVSATENDHVYVVIQCVSDSASVEDILYWLVILGEGRMKDFEQGAAPWYSYRDNDVVVLVNPCDTSVGEVTYIGAYTFADFEGGNYQPGLSIYGHATEMGEGCFAGFNGSIGLYTIAMNSESVWNPDGCVVNQYEQSYTEHTYGEYEPDGTFTHTRSCVSCGSKETSDHVLNEISRTPATCTEDGFAEYDCVCGYYRTELLWAPGHSYDDGVITKAPSHTEYGEKTYTCVRGCTRTEQIEKTSEHTYVYDLEYASFEHKGVCECGDIVIEEHTFGLWLIGRPYGDGNHGSECKCGFIRVEPHQYVELDRVEPTHTSDGVSYVTCSVCNYENEIELPKTEEHEFVPTDIKYPTHTEYGCYGYLCSCGEYYEEVIEKLADHIYDGWESLNDAAHINRCVCGEYMKAPHSFDNGAIEKQPDHGVAGQKKYTCVDCGFVRKELIAPIDHEYEYLDNEDESTHLKWCSCGYNVSESHVWGEWIVIEEKSNGKDLNKRACFCGAEQLAEIKHKGNEIEIKPVQPEKDKDKVKIDVVFDVPTLEAIGIEVIPEILEQLNNMETSIDTDLGSVILDAIASSKLAGQDGPVNIGICDITTDHEEKTGRRVFNITINDENGNPILPPSDSDNNGTVTLSFKYHKGLAKEQVKIAYRDENGKLEFMEVEHYDPETGEVRFKTSHLSEYVIYTEEINPEVYTKSFFEFKGYSINEATGQIGYGFYINYGAIAAYEAAMGVELDYGIVFASYELLGGEQPLDMNGDVVASCPVLKSSLSGFDYASYDFVLTDISADLYSHRFVVAAYASTENGIKYYQSNGSSDTVEGVSYNEVQAAVKGEI